MICLCGQVDKRVDNRSRGREFKFKFGCVKRKVLSILCEVCHRGSGHKGMQGGGLPGKKGG